MRYPIEIEDIEESRRRQGIEDVDLRADIRGLRVGDVVKLTFAAGPHAVETLQVRITSIRDAAFRGKLEGEASTEDLARLRPGSSVAFTTAHIHSLLRKRPRL